jgi:hypothetical protein
MKIYTKCVHLINMLNRNKIFLILLIISISAFTGGDHNYVKLLNHQKKAIPFKIKTQKIEWINNVINIALLSTDNRLIQINSIPESMLTDTTFRNHRVQVMMIDNNDITFTQNKRFLPLIAVKCNVAESGHSIAVNAQGKIFYQKQWYQFEVNTEHLLPKKKTLGTSKRIIN